MASRPTTLANRALVAGGFALAIAAAPVIVALATPAGPGARDVADCPPTEILDSATGACQRISDDATPPTGSPINPENAQLQTGGITEATPGDVGELPAVDGIPCTGGNVGQCIGLEQSQGGANDGVHLPQVPIGVSP